MCISEPARNMNGCKWRGSEEAKEKKEKEKKRSDEIQRPSHPPPLSPCLHTPTLPLAYPGGQLEREQLTVAPHSLATHAHTHPYMKLLCSILITKGNSAGVLLSCHFQWVPVAQFPSAATLWNLRTTYLSAWPPPLYCHNSAIGPLLLPQCSPPSRFQ